jgi:hypothetical protein
MIQRIVSRITGLFGYQLEKSGQKAPYLDYDYGAEAHTAIEICKSNSMMPHVNLATLYEQAVYCEKSEIPGDYVECGVWKGGAVGMMAAANLKHGKSRRKLHLFDSFDDICEPDPEKDGKFAVEDMKRLTNPSFNPTGKVEAIKGVYDQFGGHGTIDACNELLVEKVHYPKENIIYHKGWFQDTLKLDASQIDQIAILRLDGDWYDSVKICLEYLYPKVSKGGMIVIDDYGYYEGCTKAVDEYLKENKIKTFLSYSRFGCRYFVKP